MLLAAADNVLRTAGVPGLAEEQADHEATRTMVRDLLGEVGFDRHWARGSRMGAAQAINFALEKYGPLTG